LHLFLPCFCHVTYKFFASRRDDEEPSKATTATPSISHAVSDEPPAQEVAPRVTRASVKKVPQARYPKRSKKAKETDASLEAHASTVSYDDVSISSLLAFLSYASALTHSFS
jgi:hypothetical protein